MRRPKMVRLFLACSFLIAFSALSHAQPIGHQNLQHQLRADYLAYSNVNVPDSLSDLPPVKVDDVLAQGFTGLLAGAAGAFLGGIVTSQLFSCKGAFCELGLFVIGGSAGYVGGSSLVIHSFENKLEEDTYYPAVLLGDVMGFLFGYMIFENFAEGNTLAGRIASGVAIFTLPISGALAGYYLSRKPVDRDQDSFVDLSADNVKLSVPSVSIKGMHPLVNNSMAPTVSLLSIQF